MINKRMQQYKSLCKETANALLGDSVNQPLTALFEECPSCKEINLWTYWHGIESLDAQNDSVHPKILLVGQDWGCCATIGRKTIEELLVEVENNPAKYNETFCALNNGTVTDKNLKCLFCKIGYDLDKKQSDLFFTNLIPYYRKDGEKISGFKRIWLTPAIAKSFRKLVEILEPQVVLCLGKNTYSGVLDALRLDKGNLLKKSYNSFLDSHSNFQIHDGQTCKCKVFALAHCGGLGIRNRSLEKQLDDWKRVKDSIL